MHGRSCVPSPNCNVLIPKEHIVCICNLNLPAHMHRAWQKTRKLLSPATIRVRLVRQIIARVNRPSVPCGRSRCVDVGKHTTSHVNHRHASWARPHCTDRRSRITIMPCALAYMQSLAGRGQHHHLWLPVADAVGGGVETAACVRSSASCGWVSSRPRIDRITPPACAWLLWVCMCDGWPTSKAAKRPAQAVKFLLTTKGSDRSSSSWEGF